MEETTKQSVSVKEKIKENQHFWKELLTAKDIKTPEKKTYLTADEASRHTKEKLYKQQFSKTETETKEKLMMILEQIKQVAKGTPVSRYTQQTLKEPILNPGIYHITFFEHVLTTIKDTKLDSDKARTWKHVVTQKGEKKKHSRTNSKATIN